MRFRTLTGGLIVLAIALIVVADLYLPGRPLGSVLMTTLACGGWLEYARIAGISGKGPKAHLGLHLAGLGGVIYFFVLAWTAPSWTEPRSVDAWMLGGLGSLCLVASVLVVVRPDYGRYYGTFLETVAGSVLYGLLLSYFLRIYRIPGREGPLFWAILVAGVKGNDMVAYFVGKTWGRHRFLAVSPKKTLEGCLGAIVFSVLYFGAAGALVGPAAVKSLFPWYGGMLFGMIISIASQAGDLVESLLKRTYQVKDSGMVLPEFGGVLDMIDSLTFTGFIFWWTA